MADYDIDRDFVSDYLGPGLALGGVMTTGVRGARDMSWEELKTPWRRAKAGRDFYRDFGARQRDEMAAMISEMSEGKGAAAQARKVAEMMIRGNGVKVDDARVFFPEVTEAAQQAWQITSRKFGTPDEDLWARIGGDAQNRLNGKSQFTEAQLEATRASFANYLQTRPEFAKSLGYYYARTSGLPAGAFDQIGDPSAFISSNVGRKSTRWVAANEFNFRFLERQGRHDLIKASKSLAGVMGEGAEISYGMAKHVQGPVSIRFKSGQALVEIPIVRMTQNQLSSATMWWGEHAHQRLTPRQVARADRLMPFLDKLMDPSTDMLSTRAPAGVIQHMDTYMLEKMREGWRGVASASGFNAGTAAATGIRDRIMNKVIFEANDHMKSFHGVEDPRNYVSGWLGVRRRAEMMVVDKELLGKHKRKFNQEFLVEAMSRWGKDVIAHPQAIEKDIFLNPLINWNQFSFTGAYTQARPDQLIREFSLSKTPHAFDMENLAVSASQHEMEKRIGQKLPTARVVSVSEQAWEHVAKMDKLPEHLRRLAPEEFIGAPQARELQFSRRFSHTIDLSHGMASEKVRKLLGAMMSDAAISAAMVEGTLQDHISAMNASNRSRWKTLSTFAGGEVLGLGAGNEFVEAARLGGVQRLHGMDLVDNKLTLYGMESVGWESGIKTQGTKWAKKTGKGWMRGFHRRAAMALAMSEHMAWDATRGTDTAAPGYMAQLQGELFEKGRHGWRLKDVARNDYLNRVAGSIFLTTEGPKAIGRANADEFTTALANEIMRTMKTGPRMGFSEADHWRAARHLRNSGMFMFRDGRMIRNRGFNPVDIRRTVFQAGEMMGITRAQELGLGFDDLFGPGATAGAWESFSKVHGIGAWNTQIAFQGTPEGLGAGRIGSANQRVIEALRMQGMTEVAEEFLTSVSGKSHEFTEMMGLLDVRPGENVVHVDRLQGQALEDIFHVDPAMRRQALQQRFGVTPGEALTIDLGSEFDLPVGDEMKKVRYLRTSPLTTGHIGGYMADQDTQVLRSIDRNLRNVIQSATGLGPDPGTLGRGVTEALEGYYGSIKSATMGKRMAGAWAFSGELADSVQLQYQSGFNEILNQVRKMPQVTGIAPGPGSDWSGGLRTHKKAIQSSLVSRRVAEQLEDVAMRSPEGFYLRAEKAMDRFGLSAAEADAFRTGGTAGRVEGGFIYGTIHRQPIEGLQRVSATRFGSVEALLKDIDPRRRRGILDQLKQTQIWSDEFYSAALGADMDADQVVAKALRSKKARDMARAVVKVQIGHRNQLFQGMAEADIIEGMKNQLSSSMELRGQALEDFTQRAFRMGTAQHGYMKLQTKIQAALKAPSHSPYSLADAFSPGSHHFVQRQLARYTEAYLEKQMVGRMSNAAHIALTAFAESATTGAEVSKAGMLLGNLTERVIKAKYSAESELTSGARSASAAVDILSQGDTKRLGELKNIVRGMMSGGGRAGQSVEEMLGVAEGILQATSRFKENNAHHRTMKLLSRKDTGLEDLFKLRTELARPGNRSPLAIYQAARMASGGRMEAARFAYEYAKEGVRANLSTMATHMKKYRTPALVGIGAGIGVSILFGDPGSVTARGDNVTQAKGAHQSIGSPSQPPPDMRRTARVTKGRSIEARAVAGRRLASYNFGQNLSAAVGPGTSTNIQMSDYRSHVDNEYILRRLGV